MPKSGSYKRIPKSVQVGEVYGRLTVVGLSDRKPDNCGYYWDFRCSCGAVVTRNGTQVKFQAKSGADCACLRCHRRVFSEKWRARNAAVSARIRSARKAQFERTGSLYSAFELAEGDE